MPGQNGGRLEALSDAIRPLQDYASTRSEQADLREFGGIACVEAVRLAGAESASAWLWEASPPALRLLAFSGFGDESGAEAATSEWAERAWRSGREELSGPGAAQRLALPLLLPARAIGALVLCARRPLRADGFLTLWLSQFATLLHQLSLCGQMQRFHIELIETLYRTVNASDIHSRSHAEQTRKRSRRLAEALRLSAATARHVEYASLLRGVGKIGVDQAILNKPGKLTPKEYEQIKKFTSIGHQLLADVPLLAPAARMVLHHQEWFNGQGYPEGLKGEDIPMGARIIAVISAWEAMTSPRPYRQALPPEQARAELRRGAGTQFDPKVVEAFLSLEQENSSRPGAG